jgi:hypothetical protein
VRLADPEWLEFRTIAYDQQNRQVRNAIGDQRQQLERRRVAPVCILKDHEHRRLVRQAVELPKERLECPLLPLLRTERRR